MCVVWATVEMISNLVINPWQKQKKKGKFHIVLLSLLFQTDLIPAFQSTWVYCSLLNNETQLSQKSGQSTGGKQTYTW